MLTLKGLFVSIALTAAFIVPFVQSAEAKSRHHHHRSYNTHQRYAAPPARAQSQFRYVSDYQSGDQYQAAQQQYRHSMQRYHRQMRQYQAELGHVVGGRPDGCPRQYCGCATSLKVFGKIIPSLNLASNWYRFPRAHPSPGMVAVRNHHVMVITAYDGNGNATVYDPNSGGHATRIHQRSLAGYTVVNPHGGRMAQL